MHEIYSEDIPYDFCGKSFRTRELMKLHQAKDDNECPRFLCNTCGERFGSNYHLKRHEVTHTDTDEEFPREFSSRIFKGKNGLSNHISKTLTSKDIEVKSQTNSKYSEKYSLEFSLEEAIKGSECFDHFTTELVNFESTSSEFHLTHSGQYIETFEPLDDATNEEQRKLEDAEKKKQAFNQGTINPMVHQVIR